MGSKNSERNTILPTHNQRTGINDLPTELLSRILESERPSFSRDKGFYEGNLGGVMHKLQKFRNACKVYSRLRLVSSRFHETIAPLLYREGVLMTNPTPSSSSFDKIKRFFGLHARYISALAIVGLYQGIREPYADVSEALQKELSRCVRLTGLACFGASPAFLTRPWMPKVTPVFARNITSLAVVIAFEIPNLSYPLLALGGTLETLVVYATGASPAPPSTPSISFPIASATRPAPSLPTSIFLPKSFPNLRQLSWNHEGVDTAHLKVMKRLFSCFDEEAKTSLKSLHFNLRWTFARGVVELLSIRGEHSSVHLGARLTTLHLHLKKSEYYPSSSDVAAKVLELCSNLVDFDYEPPFSKTALELFPLSLQRLHLVIYSHEGIWFEDIAEFLRSNQLPDLRIFRFNTRQPFHDTSDAAPVLDVCQALNITSSIANATGSCIDMSLIFP